MLFSVSGFCAGFQRLSQTVTACSSRRPAPATGAGSLVLACQGFHHLGVALNTSGFGQSRLLGGIRFFCLRGKLQHGRALALAKMREQHDLAVWKFQRIMMRAAIVHVHLPEPRDQDRFVQRPLQPGPMLAKGPPPEKCCDRMGSIRRAKHVVLPHNVDRASESRRLQFKHLHNGGPLTVDNLRQGRG